MPHSIRHGDQLAGRYRLVDLLSESGDGRFWRAHDRVLERQVAIHVIAADDDRAAGLLEAARRSATVHDPHVLRVLDAERTDALCYVVNEWGSGTSLDIMLAAGGPLAPRRAAWLVAEVAAAAATAHRAGVSHGRLNPENVLVDRNGSVRLIGLCVDAALHGLTHTDPDDDLTDLAGLLYAALTGRWAGISGSVVVPAPQEHGRLLRPRQVRAGIPRMLDQLCDNVLNPATAAQRGHDPRCPATAQALADQLVEFVGDPVGIPEELATRLVDRGDETISLPAVPGPTPAPAPVTTAVTTAGPAVAATPAAAPVRSSDPLGPAPSPTSQTSPASQTPGPEPADQEPTTVVPLTGGTPETPTDTADTTGEAADPATDAPTTVVALPDTGADTDAGTVTATHRADDSTRAARAEEATRSSTPGDGLLAGSSPAPVAAEQPTQAGLPIFDDETDDVSWLQARSEPVPPPPPFEDPPERPLFAPEPDDGGPVRRARPGAEQAESGEFWPWGPAAPPPPPGSDDAEPDDGAAGEVPGRNTFRLAAALLLGLVLLVGVVVAVNVGRGRTPLGAEPEPEGSSSPSASSSATPTAAPTPLTGLSASDLDPQGDPPQEEYPELTPLAVDGDPATVWRTATYLQNFGPGGLKTGVGLVVDLGGEQEVSEVDLTLVGEGTATALYVTDTAPTDVEGLDPVAETSGGTQQQAVLDEPVTGSYLTVWLTSLPAVEGGWRGEVAEVEVRG